MGTEDCPDARCPDERCLCLLRTLAVAMVLLLGLMLPSAITYSSERAAKARYLCARGHALRVQAAPLERLRAWLRCHRLSPDWCTPPLLVLLVTAPVGLWLASEALVLATHASCRTAA
jgi:hypothetical protein